MVWHGMHLLIKGLRPMCIYNCVVYYDKCMRNLQKEIVICMNTENIIINK